MNAFPWKDSCVSTNQMNTHICSKQSLSPPGNT
jgi:hypothetical protein